MVAPSRSQIRIKALQRLMKEHELYLQEEQEIMTGLKTLQDSNGDEYEIKKVQQVLDETRRVAPSVRRRLEAELDNIKGIEVPPEDEDELSEVIAKTEAYLSVH